MIELTDAPAPVSAEELTAAEARLAEIRQSIPASYKAFLAEHDGGEPVRSVFTFERDNEPKRDRVRSFLGLAPVSPPDENLVETAMSLAGRVPDGVLPIAEDSLGNVVCLDGREGGDGPVLFWDHEYEGEPPDEANLYLIAPNLQAFLDGLEEPPERPRPPAGSKPKGLKRLFGRG